MANPVTDFQHQGQNFSQNGLIHIIWPDGSDSVQFDFQNPSAPFRTMKVNWDGTPLAEGQTASNKPPAQTPATTSLDPVNRGIGNINEGVLDQPQVTQPQPVGQQPVGVPDYVNRGIANINEGVLDGPNGTTTSATPEVFGATKVQGYRPPPDIPEEGGGGGGELPPGSRGRADDGSGPDDKDPLEEFFKDKDDRKIGSGDITKRASGDFTPREATVSRDALRDLDDQHPLGAFRRGLANRGVQRQGLLGRILDDQFGGYQIANLFRNRLAEQEDPRLEAFVTSTGSPTAVARQQFNTIAAGNPFKAEGQNEWLTRYGAFEPEDETTARAFASEFIDLARLAATDRYGPTAARYLPSTAGIQNRLQQDEFERARQSNPGPDMDINLIDRLRRAFGL
jgi:hypothetical protein